MVIIMMSQIMKFASLFLEQNTFFPLLRNSLHLKGYIVAKNSFLVELTFNNRSHYFLKLSFFMPFFNSLIRTGIIKHSVIGSKFSAG